MGYLLVTLSALCYGLVPLFQSIAINNGLSAESTVFFGYLFCLLFTWILCKINKVKLTYNKKEMTQILIVSVFGYFATEMMLNLAYEHLPSGMVTVIHFTYPTLVCLINCLFFKTRFTLWRLLALVLSILGLIGICWGEFKLDMIGLLFALGSAISFSFVVLYTDKSELHNIDDNRKFFIVYIVCILSSLSAKLTSGAQDTVTLSNFWPIGLAGGLLLGGDLFLSLGIKKVGSTSAAFISALEPIASLCATMIVFKVRFGAIVIVGSVLIILSLLPNIIADRNNNQ